MRNLFLLLAFAGALTCGFAQAPANGSSAAEQSIAKAVNPENLRAHVRFLASDLLEGRGTGQRGGDIAAEYIATVFSTYGLKPIGDQGTYMQKVPMVGVQTKPESTFAVELPKNGAMDAQVPG